MRVIEDCMVRLLKSRPFYGQFLLQCRREVLRGTAPAGVTLQHGIPTLAINPENFALFSPEEQQALLEHLTRHLLHLHPSRRRERIQRTWDLACDLAVNADIANLPPESPVPARLRLPDHLSAEEYYARLPRMPYLGHQQGGGEDSGEELIQNDEVPNPIDDHQLWQQADCTPQNLAQQVVRQMVQTTLRRCHQEIPAELRELITPYLQPPAIPWQQILRQFVGCVGRIGRRTTWMRNHRRFGRRTPGVRKKARLNLLVAVDASDSTNQQALREAFAAELLHIARGRESLITLLYSGSHIQKIETFSGRHETMEVYRGGGYTDLRPVFDYARQMIPRPAAIIYLTDGYGQAPETEEFPTLWALTCDGQKPTFWGIELRLNTEETS